MKIIALLVVLIVVLALAYIRLAPLDPQRWHVDPLTVTPPSSPNFYLQPLDESIYSEEPVELLRQLDALVMAEAGTRVLAGSPEEGWITYVQRTRIMGYPDLISVRAVQGEDGTKLALFSRSRFGYSDVGVNEARIRRWLEGLRELQL